MKTMNVRESYKYFGMVVAIFVLFESNVYAFNALRKQAVDIVFIGNSITLGVTLEHREKEAPPVFASEFLLQKSRGLEVRFLNNGRNGATTVDFLPSSKKHYADLIKSVGQFHYDSNRLLVFSISLGTNDSAIEGTNGAPVKPESYFINLKSITDQLLIDFPNCKIIFQQPIWYSPNTYNSSKYLEEGLSRLQSYFPELKLLVNSYQNSYPKRVYMGDKKGFKYFKRNYLTDVTPENGKKGVFYLHPNKKGAEALGGFWGKAIYKKVFNH